MNEYITNLIAFLAVWSIACSILDLKSPISILWLPPVTMGPWMPFGLKMVAGVNDL